MRFTLSPVWGLSPRLRGNRLTRESNSPPAGSIPAPAGEPRAALRWSSSAGVYPRACGGTARFHGISQSSIGLSPRLRGNPGTGYAGRQWRRSIPAPAGEPYRRGHRRAGGEVYPRACGGTCSVKGRVRSCSGLSPRLRGNLDVAGTAESPQRSIPAPAGEPVLLDDPFHHDQVYPRACGGTPDWGGTIPALFGLSPRLRGNPPAAGPRALRYRSIPAPAGEPSQTSGAPSSPSVYPRACGGTLRSDLRVRHHRGLSPRLRGNLTHSPRACGHSRSIPAPAGEPTRGI